MNLVRNVRRELHMQNGLGIANVLYEHVVGPSLAKSTAACLVLYRLPLSLRLCNSLGIGDVSARRMCWFS